MWPGTRSSAIGCAASSVSGTGTRDCPPARPFQLPSIRSRGFLADYTAKAGTRYVFRIVPLFGTVKNPKLADAAAVTLNVTTEIEGDQPTGAADHHVRHDVFFNRGVIGSQAYAREFGNRTPDAQNPRSEEMKWLSRGLFEALVRFIGLARDGMGLRAAFYEFRYLPVANAFAKAIEAGADVKIVYDAESDYKADNETTISTAGLDGDHAVVPRTVTEGIRHNKFIVLLKGDKPVASGPGRRMFPPAASSVTRMSVTSHGTKSSPRNTSTIGGGLRTTSRRRNCAPRTKRQRPRLPESHR